MPINSYIFWILSSQSINVLIQQLQNNTKHWNHWKNGKHWPNRQWTIETLQKGEKYVQSQLYKHQNNVIDVNSINIWKMIKQSRRYLQRDLDGWHPWQDY